MGFALLALFALLTGEALLLHRRKGGGSCSPDT